MKKHISFLFAVVLVFTVLFAALPYGAQALENPEADEAQAVMLVHNDSGTVLYAKNAEMLMPAGVGTRLLAALTFLERYGTDTGRLVTVDRRVTGVSSSTLVTTSGAPGGLKGGEQVSVYDLLCAMLIANSEDAAYAMAFDLFAEAPNPVAAAVQEMEHTAQRLGAENTIPVDLTGRAPAAGEAGSTASAADLMKIALAAQKNVILRGICGTARYVIPETDRTAARLLLTRNSFLSAERVPGFTYSAATGLVAQESAALGSHGVFTCEYEGRGYTCVVLGGSAQQDAFRVARRCFEWGAKNFSYKKVLDKTEIIAEVKVELSSEFDYVTVSPVSAISVFLPNDVDISKEIAREVRCESLVQAPVNEGQKLGTIDVYYKGERIGSCDLVTNGSLPLSNSGYYFSLFLNFITSPVFITIVIVVLAMIVIYIFVNARVRYLRKTRPAALDYDDSDDDPPRALNESAIYEAFAAKEEGEDAEKTEEAAQQDKKKQKKDKKSKKRGKKKPAGEKSGGKEKDKQREKGAGNAPAEEPDDLEKLSEREPDGADAGSGFEEPEPEELTTLEILANEEEERERARLEEEERLEKQRAAEESEKQTERKTFYDLERDEMTPGGETADNGTEAPESDAEEPFDEDAAEEKSKTAYEPDGWGDHR